MKKLFTLLMTLWIAIGSLFAINLKGGEVLYLTPHTTWNSDNARFAIYVYGSSTNQWASMTKVEGETNFWTVTVPSGNWTNVIFCRMNPGTTSNGWGDGVFWGGQTQDLTYDGKNNWFTVDSSKDAWNKPTGTWSLYSTEPVITIVSTPEFPATTIEETSTATLTYTVDNSEESATVTVDGEGFTANDVDGTITITFAPTEAKEYTATLTIAIGEVKETVELKATGLAKDVVKDPEVLNLTAPVFAEIIEGNKTTAIATYELLNADEAEAKVEGKGFSITAQEVGTVTIEFAPTEAGEYAGTLLILVAGETLKEVEFTATAKPSPYYAVRGSMTDWSAEKDIKLTANDDKSEYFIKEFEITSGAEFKVVYVNEEGVATWYGVSAVEKNDDLGSNIGTDNITLAAGKYDIYFKTATNTMWIAPVKEEPIPDPALIVSAEEVVFEELELGEEPVSATETITYEVKNSDEAVVIALESDVFTAEDVDGTITITFAPEAEGEYTAELTLTLGEIVKTIAISGSAKAAAVEPDPEPALEFALVGRLNGDNDTEILDYESGYKFTQVSEFVYTVNVTFTGTVEGREGEQVQKVKLVDSEGNIWARSSSKQIDTDGTATMTKGETGSSAYLITEAGVEYKITYTLVSDEAESLYKLSGQLTFEKVETVDPTPDPDPEPDPEPETITFTVQVPEGTVECWIAGTGEPAWTFIQMEAVEGEDNMFTLTTTKDVLTGVEWKYLSGAGWDYVEVRPNDANRTEAETPYDVVTAWKKLYDPDFQPIDPYYAIRGLNGDASWTGTGDINLVFDETESQWATLGFTVAEGESFKVIYIDENADVTGYYAGIEEGCDVGQEYDENGNIVLPAGTYDLYFKPDTELMWINKVDTPTDVEETATELIYAIDGTIIAPEPFAIIDLAGKDVTKANGSLEGTYIVKTLGGATKISVQ